MPPELSPADLATLIDYAWKKYGQEPQPMSRELWPVREVLEKLEKLDPPQPPRPPEAVGKRVSGRGLMRVFRRASGPRRR
jgi:hypothetical protein